MTTNTNKGTLILDFDGTIADTFPSVIKISNELNKILKLSEDNNLDIEYLRSLSSEKFAEYVNVPKWKIPYFVYKFRKMINTSIKDIKPFEGLDSVLRGLKLEGYSLGVVTSNSKKHVKEFLNANNMDYFDFIEDSLFLFGKDVLLKKVVKRHKLDPRITYYAGDETRDVNAARNARLRSIAVTWGFQFEDTLSKANPEFICNNPSDLLTILK